VFDVDERRLDLPRRIEGVQQPSNSNFEGSIEEGLRSPTKKGCDLQLNSMVSVFFSGTTNGIATSRAISPIRKQSALRALSFERMCDRLNRWRAFPSVGKFSQLPTTVGDALPAQRSAIRR
jgi:hypothetical protein